jgi:hypothetical protein
LDRVSIWSLAWASICEVIPQQRKRLGNELQIVAQKEVATLVEARKLDRRLKQKKNPALAVYYLQR